MDFLKTISFSIALFIIGATFLFVGLSGGFTISNYSIAIQEVSSRVISSIVGGVLIVVAIYLEVKIRSTSEKAFVEKPEVKEKHPIPPGAIRLRAEDFFFTLDDKPAQSFQIMVADAVRVRMLVRTAVNLLGQYEKVFEHLGKAGCELQLLFVDPASVASTFLYGSNPEVYRNNIVSASQHLKKLKSIMTHRLRVNVTKHAPTCSIIVVEKPDIHQWFIHVQLYFLHSALGRDRPVFHVPKGDKWYDIFQDEFTQLWADSVEWDISLFEKVTNKDHS